ncbi:MAG: DUF4386 domain-containing protein [Chthoniobacterales bacterium]
MHKPANTLEPFQHTAAKVVGFFYLFTNATAIAAFSIRGKLMVMRDAAQTAANIAGSERLFRAGIALELITVAGVLALLWGLYVVLRPVDRNLVWLGGFLRLAENIMLAFITLLEFTTLAFLRGSRYMQAFSAEQTQGLAYAFVRVYADSFNVGFFFLGLGSAVFSYIWWKSRYIPRALAGLGIIGSLTMAVVSVLIIIFPSLASLGITYMLPMGLYEFGLGFWLLIKGIRAPIT